MKYLMNSLLLTLATLTLGSTMVMADDQPKPAINVHGAWVRASAPGQEVGAAYMMFVSKGDSTLVGASTDVADHTQIHSMNMNNGIMQMRELDSLVLPAGKMVMLTPGGIHLMLQGLKKPLKAGEQVSFTLQFKDSKGVRSSLKINAPVQAQASEHDHM